MNNPYHVLLKGGLVRDALRKVAEASESRLQDFALELSDEEVLHFEELTFHKLQGNSVESALLCGGLLCMARTAADAQGRVEQFKQMTQALELTETKAYDSMHIFQHFGDLMATEMPVLRCFPVESLKMLSANSAPESARVAALELARQGERISIKRASELLYRCAEKFAAPGTTNSPGEQERGPTKKRHQVGGRGKKPAGKQVWSYSGDVVNLVVHAGSPMVHVDYASVIRDLEAALDAYRRDYALQSDRAAAEGRPESALQAEDHHPDAA